LGWVYGLIHSINGGDVFFHIDSSYFDRWWAFGGAKTPVMVGAASATSRGTISTFGWIWMDLDGSGKGNNKKKWRHHVT